MVTDETVGRNLPAWAAEDHACGSCSLAYAQITVDDAVQALQALPEQLRAAVGSVPSRFQRQRPDPSTWSVAEYACHIRDVLISTTIRLHRGRTENAPTVDPMFNDLRADLFGYNQANLTAVHEETAAAVAGLCAEISRMNSPDWERVVVRQPGEQRTSRWLVRQAMHEGLHHLDDIAAVRASLTYCQRDLPGHRPSWTRVRLEVFPHPFRRHFSRTWLDRGGAEEDLMDLNGWTSPQMLRRYGASARSTTARSSYDRITDDAL